VTLAHLSLRARLLLGVIALAAVGLVSADVATYGALRSFLLQRVDTSLTRTAHLAARPGGSAPRLSPAGILIQVRTSNGATIVSSPPSFDGLTATTLALPSSISVPAAGSTYLTATSRAGGASYRVLATVPAGASDMIVVATSLHDVDATLHHLLVIELLVTAGVLAALGVLGLWVVRIGLRPLAAIETTAEAIAAGDLSRRVERSDARTEVGRLGLALNAMLAQIESAFKAREASERKLRRFVADASHELRTPLAAVRAYAELFARGAAAHPADLERSMHGITRESERMSLLVDDLLLLARLDEGRPLAREPVELSEVVAEAVEMAHTVDPTRRIDMLVEPATVVGDRERLRQLIDNLLANVRAHTEPATPAAITLQRVNGTAQITVSDSGPGIPEEQAARVFERFYRTDSSRTRASGGAGLGLAIVAAVAEAHGGTASAEGNPGAGATFRIELPVSAS
jgi:two-component system OmpR family sensor kinase